MGKFDKALRIILGFGFLYMVYFLEKPMGYIGFVGFIPLLTAFFGFCPLYKLIGVNSCSIKTDKK